MAHGSCCRADSAGASGASRCRRCLYRASNRRRRRHDHQGRTAPIACSTRRVARHGSRAAATHPCGARRVRSRPGAAAPGAPAARRNSLGGLDRRDGTARSSRSLRNATSSSSATSIATARRPVRSACVDCACSARNACPTRCPIACHGYGLSPDWWRSRCAAARSAGDGRPRHRLPCRHRGGEGARMAGAGHRPPSAGPDPSAGRRDRQSEPRRRSVSQQDAGRRRRDVLRAARAAPALPRCRTFRRRMRTRPVDAARSRRRRDGCRSRAAGPNNRALVAAGSAPAAFGTRLRGPARTGRGRRARHARADCDRYRFRTRAADQCRGTARGHVARHRVPAQRRRRRGARTGVRAATRSTASVARCSSR